MGRSERPVTETKEICGETHLPLAWIYLLCVVVGCHRMFVSHLCHVRGLVAAFKAPVDRRLGDSVSVSVIRCLGAMPGRKRLSDKTDCATADGGKSKSAKVEDTVAEGKTEDTEEKTEAPATPVARVHAEESSASSGELARPKIPPPSQAPAGTGARNFMRQICPWVLQELPKFMHDHCQTGTDALFVRPPLQICSGAVSSFKEPWVPAHCDESLKQTGLYEAGGNLTWIDPQVADQEASDDPSWEWVYDYAKSGWVRSSFRGVSGDRIRCPISFDTYWPHYVKDKEEYPTGLKLLAAHSHLWSWYVAVYRAMCEGDKVRVKLLYESALTATVSTRVDCEPGNLAKDFLLYSERVREDSKTLIINFVTFVDKLDVIAGCEKKDLQVLQKMKLRFGGSLVNATMLKVAGVLRGAMTPESRKLVGEIDRRFGREVLSGSYNKLRLLIQGCQGKGSDVNTLVSWSLETMLIMLMRKEFTVNDFTVTQFAKQRDGSASWIAQAVATRTVVQYMQSILANIELVDAPLARKIDSEVFTKMSSYRAYNETFPKEEEGCDGVAESGASGDEEEGLETELPGDAFMEELRGKLPKAGIMFAETLRKLYDNGYDEAIQVLAAESDPLAKLATGTEDLGDLGKDLNEMMRAIHVAESVVGTRGGAGPPTASLRELVRHNSAPEDREAAETERTDVWKRAQAQRKKLITLGLVKDAKCKDSYAEVFKKAQPARAFKGEPNASQRLFVMSADLMMQSGKEPWVNASQPPDDVFEAVLEFITSHRDTFDVSLGFDGMMRKPRRSLEDHFSPLPGSAEFAVVYDKAPNACFLRKNFMSHKNVEMGYVKMPMSRTRVAVKDRADGFNASGEQSSACTSYSGVKAIPRTSLAMISPEDKAKIFTSKPDPVPKRWATRGNGVPLCWLETKSLEFWTQLCAELNIKCVVDVSPGSGILAQSCMAQGIAYFGICSSHAHLQWLSNVLDRAALKYIVQSGTFLYQEDLATHIQELFGDVLKSLEPSEEDEEAVQASDEEEGK